MTDIVKEKIAEKPNELASFKVEKQNAESFRELLNKNDLASDFVADNNGEFHCIHAAADKKAFDIIKAEFQKMHSEVAENLKVEKQEDFTVLSDKDRTFSFEEMPLKAELVSKLQSEFGYDEIKSDLAANKFADTLPAALQKKFYSDNPANFVNNFEQHIKLKDESVLVRDLDFYRVNLKENEVDCFVVMNAEGQTATLIPEMTTDKQMRETLKTRLGITDKATLEAVVDKAERVNNIYKKDIANQKHGEFDIRKNGNMTSLRLKKVIRQAHTVCTTIKVRLRIYSVILKLTGRLQKRFTKRQTGNDTIQRKQILFRIKLQSRKLKYRQMHKKWNLRLNVKSAARSKSNWTAKQKNILLTTMTKPLTKSKKTGMLTTKSPNN
jgi:hypothetical protein